MGEHNSILTDAEADKFDSEADEMNREIVRKPEVYEEANEVINEEAEIETLTNEVETSKRWQENFGKRQVVTKLCSLWATEAKALKLAFTMPMTSIICQELQESLNKEHDLLVQVSLYKFTY
ncbi:6782_t:CDS:2 [Cetraspora pellucida]|uniref:6782_t:CDS:1 n=1 Tax=Cetraspora pellucida TaxID=1433469 RepID=A0A9N9AUP3_9GLOM|nr:6782_t:CDS:2 [Cetraspora pellucida]